MHDVQDLIFRSAAHWSAGTSLAVLALGLLYTLQGFRFARLLIPLLCAGGGLVAGGLLVGLFDLPPSAVFIPAALAGLFALLHFRRGLALASAFAGAALLSYLTSRIGVGPRAALAAAGGGLVCGYALIWVCRRSLPILVTIVPGAGLLVAGFVGITSFLAPSLGLTFIEWSARIPLLVPALMLMLCILGYSVQANAMQGDIETGGRPGVSDLETS